MKIESEKSMYAKSHGDYKFRYVVKTFGRKYTIFGRVHTEHKERIEAVFKKLHEKIAEKKHMPSQEKLEKYAKKVLHHKADLREFSLSSKKRY